jgi:pimeloyl-ACP methyl ester carboxylesterase
MTYATVNGLDMYYEDHGIGAHGIGDVPVVLIHGALSAIGTSFGEMLPALAEHRRVIAVELQAHGRTADIDRPFSVQAFAADIVALLDALHIDRADLFGWSMGAAVALEIGVRHAGRVRKLVLASVSFGPDGIHAGLLDGIEQLQPEHLHGSEFHDEFRRLAEDPDTAFPALVARVKAFDADTPSWPADQIRALAAPTMLIVGDSDIIRPEHALEMFRLLGGGVPGDIQGLPAARLAMLPGTTHTGIAHRGALITPMVDEFLGRAPRQPSPPRSR